MKPESVLSETSNIYFSPEFKRLREDKSKWVIPLKLKLALEKSIVNPVKKIQ